MAMGKGLFDLEKHFAFYGKYHSNPVNVRIHMLSFSSTLLPSPLGMAASPSISPSSMPSLGRIKMEGMGTLLYLLFLGNKVVLAAQLFCWMGQFIGCEMFERAPALLENLSEAFLMAPFFVLLEAPDIFGYEPYPGFHANVSAKIEAACKEWQANKQKKNS